jgi:hypothetical protein
MDQVTIKVDCSHNGNAIKFQAIPVNFRRLFYSWPPSFQRCLIHCKYSFIYEQYVALFSTQLQHLWQTEAELLFPIIHLPRVQSHFVFHNSRSHMILLINCSKFVQCQLAVLVGKVVMMNPSFQAPADLTLQSFTRGQIYYFSLWNRPRFQLLWVRNLLSLIPAVL